MSNGHWQSILATAVALVASNANGQGIEGIARVVDGDTLEIGQTIVRLADIDAPELGQRCDGPRTLNRCGVVAARILAERIEDKVVRCEVTSIDDYGRSIARCEDRGVDLSEWLVREGYAMAFVRYSLRLVDAESEARDKLAGLWRAELEPPWEFRARRWETTAQVAPENCPIKGNISRNNGDRIYHAPWSQYYDRTRIDPSSGERWFCDEGEALAAGWRPPRR